MIQSEYYEAAEAAVPTRYLLVNMISKRMRQLQKGGEPFIDEEECAGMTNLDIVLREIGEGKLTVVVNKGEDS